MTRLSEASLADLRARHPVEQVAERLGVALRLSGRTRMGPCPICGGGPQSHRFESKTPESWVCAVCQDGGDVIRLVERACGLDFRAAVEWLGGAASIEPDEAARLDRERAAKQERKAAEAERYRLAERERLFGMWTRAGRLDGTAGFRYLRGRGLDPDGLRLRCAADVPYFHGERVDERGRRSPRRVHVGPALLAPILGPGRSFAGLHLTWLAADGSDKAEIVDPQTGEVLPSRKARGSVKGGYIDLFFRREPDALVMGEGIETVATAADVLGRPAGMAFWSAVSLGNLGGPATGTVPHPTLKHRNGHAQRLPGPVPDLSAPAIPVPDSVTDLRLLGDGDSERVLTTLALERATLRYARPGRVIRHAWAPDGCDFNDLVWERPA